MISSLWEIIIICYDNPYLLTIMFPQSWSLFIYQYTKGFHICYLISNNQQKEKKEGKSQNMFKYR